MVLFLEIASFNNCIMKTSHIIIGGIAGTTAFTLFSYMLSRLLNKNFKEPELLGRMIDTLEPDMDNGEARFTGWILHYAVGCAFAAGYSMLLKTTGLQPSVKNGLIIGAVTGIPAVQSWDVALKTHPAPPRKRSLNYYSQLLVGHAIFGAVTLFVFRHLKNKSL